jgi:undecaprenyl diphosphate synthase
MSETITAPKHVGIILDGNRRWAKANSLPTLEGHRQGAEKLKEVALAAFDKGVNYLSAYIFSTENWSRTEEEVGYLMDLVIKAVDKYLDEFHERGIKVVILGRRDGLRASVAEAIKRAEDKTASNTKGTLGLCFNYGGRREIVDAVNEAIKSDKPVSEELIAQYLYAPEIPDCDLIIRTSGEQRISNFMLWRAAYSELYFVNKHWPDFTTADLDVALSDYSGRSRRFGN